MSQPEFLTTREVADLLRVKERKVYELASAGELPCRRLTGKLLFPRAEIEHMLRGGDGPAAQTAGSRPGVLVGSHDPLLEWAAREAGSGLAAFFDGSLDGLDRFAGGEAIACGMHVFEQSDGWNVSHVSRQCADQPAVLVEWARRRQGLIVGGGAAGSIRSVGDLAGRTVALRQPTAGGRILFDHLLGAAGLAADALEVLPAPARTETDIAAAVANGSADAALGLEAMARQFRLDFVPLVEERFDLLVWRQAWFEPPMQRLLAFCRTPAFAEKARDLGGYDVSGHGAVHWNGP